MSIFICSDIHNNWSMFSTILTILNFSDEDTLVINGDLIDRGITAKPFIDFIKNHEEQIVYILGNHEQMFIEAYETGKLFKQLIEIEENSIFKYEGKKSTKRLAHEDEVVNLWLYNGGLITLNTLSKEEIDWLYQYYKKKCGYYKFIGENLFVHAGPHLYDKDYSLVDIKEWIEKEDIFNLIWDRNFFTKYAVLKRTVGLCLPCNIFIGHNSMVGHNLDFRVVTETRLDNGYKIIATDMSDFSGNDKSMLIYHLDKHRYYIAKEGQINEYEYLEENGYNCLYETDKLGRYEFLSKSDRRLMKIYNKKNNPLNEHEYYLKFIVGKEDPTNYL